MQSLSTEAYNTAAQGSRQTPSLSAGGMNNVLWEPEKGVNSVAWGLGMCVYFAVRYAFVTGSPEDKFYTYSLGTIIFVKYFTVPRS